MDNMENMYLEDLESAKKPKEFRMVYGDITLILDETDLGKVGTAFYNIFRKAGIDCKMEVNGEPQLEF